MKTIPVDLILHEVAHKLRELPEESHRALATLITGTCVDPRAVAETWTTGQGVAQAAQWIVTNRLDSEVLAPGQTSVDTRAMEVAVARRLADVGLALLVTQDAEDRTAASLLLDAARLVVGLPSRQEAHHDATQNAIYGIDAALHLEVKPEDADPAMLAHRCRREIERLHAAVNTRMEECIVLTRDRNTARTERDAALRETGVNLRRDVDRLIAEKFAASERHATAMSRARDEADVLRAECVDLKRRYDERTANVEACLRTLCAGLPEESFAAVKAELTDLRKTLHEQNTAIAEAHASAEKWQAIAVHASAELEEALDCARQDVVWVPKRISVTDLRTVAPRKSCRGCEGTGQTYGSGGGPACPDCNGTGFTAAP